MTEPTAPPAGRPTVTLPVLGTVQRRWVYVGGATVAVIVAYAYYRRRTAAPATFDPATGTPTVGGGYVNPNPGASGSSDVVDSTPESIDTNAQWTKAVLVDLAGIEVNAAFASAAIAKYLAAPHNATVALDEDELRVVRQAWSFEGKPPEGAAEPVLASPGTNPPPTTPAPGPESGALGQYAIVGQVTMTAAGSPAPIGNSLEAIARQIYGHGEYWPALAKDPANRNIPLTDIPPGTAVWVAAYPYPNP